jgi:hypothetical protein
LKWVEKVRNYDNWSKVLGDLEEGIFGKIIIIIIIIIIKFKNFDKMMGLYRQEIKLMLKSE